MRPGLYLLLFSLIGTPVLGNDLHGSGDSEWSPANGMEVFPGMDAGVGPSSGIGTDGEIPFVPNDVANWFEEYAIQKSLEEKRENRMDAAEIQSALNPVMIVQKKVVRTSSNSSGVVKTPIVNDVKTTTEKTPSGTTASVNISQTISPNVVVNVPSTNSVPAVEESKEEVESSSSDAVRRIQAYNKKVLENNLGQKNQKNGVASGSSNGLASSWKQFFSSWFSRPASGSRGGLSRRFEPLEHDEVVVSESSDETVSERPAPRELSTASSESLLSGLTSSDSWFGWVGWLVAFGLLGTLVVHLRRRPRH